MNPQIRVLSAVWGQVSAALPLSYVHQIALLLLGAIRRDAPLIAIIFVYWISGLIIAELARLPEGPTVSKYAGMYAIITAIVVVMLVVARGAVIALYERPARPLTQLYQEVRRSLATPQRIAGAIPMLVGILVFGATFASIKAAIPSISPFTWDTAFEYWDRWLHGGTAPWRLLQPLIVSPVVTNGIDWLYYFWFYIFSFIWVWQAFSRSDRRLRMQFFLTLLLGGILLGSASAMFFASAGPCYFGRMTGAPDPFQPLMQYLADAGQTHHLWALGTQEILWQGYLMRHDTVGAGISAMPSMHVAYATLFALVCWRVRRWLGIALTIYAIVIMIGSVHLGWHYAIDGYLGAIGMIAIWWVVGRILERRAQYAARRATVQVV